MAFLKYLIASILVSSAPLAPGENGWYPVEKPPKEQQADHPEDDPSIWVLFTKDLGSERLQIHFPEDPTYRHNEAGDLEIISKKDGEIFQLTVKKLKGSFSQGEEKWAYENFVQTKNHLFHLKAQTASPEMANQFFSSFSV